VEINSKRFCGQGKKIDLSTSSYEKHHAGIIHNGEFYERFGDAVWLYNCSKDPKLPIPTIDKDIEKRAEDLRKQSYDVIVERNVWSGANSNGTHDVSF